MTAKDSARSETARLTSVLTRLTALSAMSLSPAASALLAEALTELRDILGQDAPQIDVGVFDRLLALAGPEVAPELLRQLAEDLSGVSEALTSALAGNDRAAVRAQTHVLMALAGSVGANPLYTATARLNEAAHGTETFGPQGAEVLAGLAQLRGIIDDTRSTPPESPR